jgi:hypothetical protein
MARQRRAENRRAGNKKPLQPKPEGSGSVGPAEHPEVSDADEDEVEAKGKKHGSSFQEG